MPTMSSLCPGERRTQHRGHPDRVLVDVRLDVLRPDRVLARLQRHDARLHVEVAAELSRRRGRRRRTPGWGSSSTAPAASRRLRQFHFSDNAPSMIASDVSHEQSRRNAARRGRRVAARHAQAGHWEARPAPMLSTGPVHYEVGGNVDATCFGGIAAVHRLVTRLGLPEAIDADLELLKVHLPYHESDHVLNLAYNVACGGTRLEDIERLRHDIAYMNALGADLIPDPTTAGDFCRRFSADDVTTLMEAINSVRPKLWDTRGRDLLGPVAYLDIDGTIAPTTGSRKQGMDMSYKGIWGYAPLIVSLANTREVLYLVNRSGNAPSHQGAAEWIDKAIDLVSPHAPRVCLRGDTDFSLTANFDAWAQRVDFVFGMDNSTALRSRAEALDESLGPAGTARPLPERDRAGAGPPGGHQGGDRGRAGVPEPAAGPRGRRRVRLPAGQVHPPLPGRRAAQEHQPRPRRAGPAR